MGAMEGYTCRPMMLSLLLPFRLTIQSVSYLLDIWGLTLLLESDQVVWQAHILETSSVVNSSEGIRPSESNLGLACHRWSKK